MLEHAIYSVASPEACASIVWRSSDKAEDAAEAMKLTAKDLIKLKIKTACIVTFLKGKDKKKVNESDCYAIGKTIAKMHLVTKKIKLTRKNSMGIRYLKPLLQSIKFKSNKRSNLKKFLCYLH